MGLQQEHNIIKIQVLRKLLDIPVALETIILKTSILISLMKLS